MIALKRVQTCPIGLHLGPRSVTLIQLAGPPEQRSIFAMAYAPLPGTDGVAPTDRDRMIVETIRQLLSGHRFRGGQVVSCLGSEELFLQNVRLPQLPAEEVDKVVQWEAEERLPYPVGEAEIRHLVAGEVRQDANIKQEVILMACHRGVLKRHVGILEQAGLAPQAIDAEPCAIVRSFSNGNGEDATRRAYLHLGDAATAVIFAEGSRILFLKYVNRGGIHFDQAVAQHLALPVQEAAQMRDTVLASTNLDPDNEIHQTVIEAIRRPLESLSAEVELCMRYFKVTFRGKPLEKVIVTGSEASPWLVEFFEKNLQTPCELGNPFQSLEHLPVEPELVERPGRWATAIGLSQKQI